MVLRQTTTTAKTVASRPLPPLPKLRVKNPNKKPTNPCTAVLSSVLGCWASQGYNMAGCAQIEQQLRNCMDAPRGAPPKPSTVNYHLSRMYKRMIGPTKKN